MEITAEQDNALNAVKDWMSRPEDQLFYLAGYAGTGKTTLAKYFAEGVKGTVLFAAFTGKAAHVLNKKGCPANTLHKLIYLPKNKCKSRLKELQDKLKYLFSMNSPEKDIHELERQIKLESENVKKPAFNLNMDSVVREASLVILDECSMIDEFMATDLLSFGSKVLVLGDPGQLPPVRGRGFFTQRTPDFQLEEIHRQARDNPILRLATDVRANGGLVLGQYGESHVVKRGTLGVEAVSKFDQVIVGKNTTRYAANAKIRKHGQFMNPLPMLTDKVVCLRNNHDLGLLNGSLWTVTDVKYEEDLKSDDRYDQLMNGKMDQLALQVRADDNDESVECMVHTLHFLGKGSEISPWEHKDAEEFDFGYALTCHKAQGSQWDSVVVFDESACFKQNAKKWLYTAITRAAERVTVVV